MSLALVLALRLIGAALLLPRWQGPDEPQHVYLISSLVGGYGPLREAEAATVESMYRNGWWEHFQLRRPQTVPHTFIEGPANVTDVRGAPGGPIVFHRVVAWMLRGLDVKTVDEQYAALRLAGACLGFLTFWIVWKANRLLFGWEIAIGAAAVVALLPQYLLVSLNANPDGAVLGMGALIWLCAALVITRRAILLAVTAAWLCALAGVAIRRLAFPLLLDAAIITALALALGSAHHRRQLAVVIVGGTAMAFWLAASSSISTALSWSAAVFRPHDAFEGLLADPALIVGLAVTLFKSFWLTGGWMRYPAPLWWYGFAVVIVTVAFAGCVLQGRHLAPLVRRGVGVAALFAVIQLVAIFIVYIPIRTGVQGRYLMPVIGPIVALLATGVLAWPWPRRAATAVLITVLGGLDVIAWSTVLIPAYGPPL